MDGDALGTDIKTAIDGLSQEEKEDLELAWQTIAGQIAIHHLASLPVVPVPSEETVDPTVDDDETGGYDIGSWWLNTSRNTLWTCIDASEGAAKWRIVSGHPTANLYPTTDITTVAATWTTVPIDLVHGDVWGAGDAANNKYVIPVSGMWHIGICVQFQNVQNDNRLGARLRNIVAGNTILVAHMNHYDAASPYNIESSVVNSQVRWLAKDTELSLEYYSLKADAINAGIVNTFMYFYLVRQ